MADPRLYTIRPFSKPARSDLKDVFRAYLSPANLLLYKLHYGDACFLQTQDGKNVPVIAWNAPEKIQDIIVQTSKFLQDLHGLKLGDKVSIRLLDKIMPEAQTVVLLEMAQDGQEPLQNVPDYAQRDHWSWFLEYPLGKAETLSVGMVFGNIEIKGQRRSFKIETINSNRYPDELYRFGPSSIIQIREGPATQDMSFEAIHGSLAITRDGIGGLARQLDQLNQRLTAYSDDLQNLKLPTYYRAHRGGILLHGQSGTGKSLLLHKISELGWRKVYWLDGKALNSRDTNSDTIISKMFTEARQGQPSAIIIDRLETLASKVMENDNIRTINIAPRLCEEFDRLDNSRVLVLGATTDLGRIDEGLRRPGRFEFQIETSIPDSTDRTEILKILSNLPCNAPSRELEHLGDRTHGYVGADLDKLVQLAVDKAKARTLAVTVPFSNMNLHVNEVNGICDVSKPHQAPVHHENEIVVEVIEEDLDNALLEVRPTAMQEIFLETPKVRWSDVGGQHEIKKSLKQAVEWPFKFPKEMARLGIEPKKGLLLYGPPGCSKTLIAKAVATEAGLNFLAVKGAELLSMYVGESERAVREVFRKARAASPSIIFFDEVDAIGAARDGQHGSLNVLTTLLNELDGIEVLKGVFVLAATNKPEVLDPALMRPGRLDTIFYVGLPDLDARQEILMIRIRRMDIADDVKVEWLAAKTDGYSGAELVSICQKAGYAALEEQEFFVNRMQVGTRHFNIGLREVPRQITKEMRERYEKWGSLRNT